MAFTLGKSDMSVQEIRAKTDKPLIIGWSVNRLDEAKIGENLAEIDYFELARFSQRNRKRIRNQH